MMIGYCKGKKRSKTMKIYFICHKIITKKKTQKMKNFFFYVDCLVVDFSIKKKKKFKDFPDVSSCTTLCCKNIQFVMLIITVLSLY